MEQKRIYFAQPDVLVKIKSTWWSREFKYTSHRALTPGEQVGIEKTIRNIIEAEYACFSGMDLSYEGIDLSLEKGAVKVAEKIMNERSPERAHTINSSVRNLIDESLSAYYFRTIGYWALEIREAIATGVDEKDSEIKKLVNQMSELIEAYNIHASDRKPARLEEILPEEAWQYLETD